VKARAPLKVLGRVGLRAGAVNGDLSGEAASVRQPDGVDEQISTLLQSLEVELSSPTSSVPVGQELPTKSKVDRHQTLVRPRRRTVGKARGLDRARPHKGIRRRLAGDRAFRENMLWIIAAVMLGIGVGLAIPLIIG
jgi:hypothetical protein